MNQGVKPYYTNAGPNQNAYYWGAHPYMKTMNDLMTTYNNVPNAPATPFGPAHSAVGGNAQLNIPQFIASILGNPQYAGAASGTAPGTVSSPGTPYVPVGPVVPGQ